MADLPSKIDFGLSAIRTPSDASTKATPWQRVRALAALERSDIWVLLVYSVAIGIFTLAMPLAAQVLVNSLAFTGLKQPIAVLALLVLLVLGVGAVLNVLRYASVERLKQRLFVRASHDAALRLSQAHADAYVSQSANLTVNGFFDVMTLQRSMASLLMSGLSVFLQGSISLLLLAFYHPWLAAFDAVIVLGILFIVFVLGRNAAASAIKESKAKHKVAAWLQQVAHANHAFKVPSASEMAFSRTDALVKEWLTYRNKHFVLLQRQNIASYVLQALSMAGLLGLGGFLVIGGQLTLGQLVAAELVVAGVVGGLAKLGSSLADFYDMLAAIEKLGAIADLKQEQDQEVLSRERKASGAAVAFKDVTAKYPNGHVAVANFSLAIASGEAVAVLGRDSSGKSTLADLVFAQRYPAQGCIELDNVDTRALSLSQIREDVAIAGGAEIFDGSVLDNITMGRSNLPAEVIAELLSASGLEEEIARLPDGINTKIGPGGTRLTSSQGARLMIARAIAGRPRVVVLDECLDGLGAPMIERIMQWLLRPNSGFTLLVLTSRGRVARQVGRYVVLEKGSIVAPDASEGNAV